MALLSSLVMKAAKAVNVALETTSVAFVHPIKTIQAAISPTKTVAQVADEYLSQSVSKQVTQLATSTIGYLGAAAVTAKVASVGVKAAVTAAIPSTTKGKVIAAVATPVIVGAAVSQPAQTAKAITQTPQALSNVGANVAKIIAEPSISNVKTLVSENPVIVGGAIAAATIAGGAKLIPAIAVARQTEAIQEQTEAIKSFETVPKTVTSQAISQPSPYVPTTAITPATQILTPTKTTTARKKRSVKARNGNISQRVNVIVANNNRTLTKKYINREVLLN